MSYDPFATSTGLIDRYSGTVIESWFGINARYNEDQHLLFWKIKLDNPEQFPQIEDGEIQEQFSLGDVKWESFDGGATVEYPGNPEKNFAANSQYGTVINRAVGEWELRSLLQSRGVPQEGKIWVGLRFEFQSEQLTKPFKNQAGELVTPKPKVMPVAYLGDGPADEPEKEYDLSALGLDIDKEHELRTAAETSNTYGEFLDKSMKLQWVSGDATMTTALADQSLWQALKLI